MAEQLGQGIEEDQEENDKDPSVHSFTLSTGCSWPNAVKWSLDERLAIITDNVIHILSFSNSTKRRQPGEDFGLTFDSSVIPLVPYQTDDVGLQTSKFGNGDFDSRQKFILDHCTIKDRSAYTDPDSFSNVFWSPLGCTSDGRSILATQSANGEVYIHTLTNMLGKWEPTFEVSKTLRNYLKDKSWLQADNNIKEPIGIKAIMKEFSRRKHLLFTTALCWCPVVWPCNECLVNEFPDDVSYTIYHISFPSCNHGKYMFCTASKSGYLFLWNITYHKLDASKHNISVACELDTEIRWPLSIAWFQLTTNEALIAIGFTNGVIVLYQFLMTYESIPRIESYQKVNLWDEKDDIAVSNLAFIQTKLGKLNLVACKGSDIVIFREVSMERVASIEKASSCHTSPIVSLQCVKERFIVTASNGATQYVDIENEIQPYCDNTKLRGFRCHGIAADPSLCMFVRVSCPSRLLLLQSSFVKQMEVSFLPFLSTDDIAQLLVNDEVNLNVIVREYFLVCSAENFVLPSVLHRYCEEPESYDKTSRELQMYLYFNRMRYMQTTGMRANTLTNEELSSLWKIDKVEDEVIQKIDRAIEKQFFKEMLSKIVQLLNNQWIKITEKGILSLKLISDYLVRCDLSSDGLDLPKKCYEFLNENTSVAALEALEKASHSTVEKKQKDGEGLQERDWKLPREKCPFCGVDIFLSELYKSKCTNGHWYTRCALTLQACKFRAYRACIGCERKVSCKNTSGKLNIESILLNIDICTFCGCRLIDSYR